MGGMVNERKKNHSITESSCINTSKLTRKDIREIMDKEVKKMTKDTTIQNILWENVKVKVSDPCENDESDAQGDGPAECNLTANVETSEEHRKVLTAEPKELNKEGREYRQMLKWDLR
ncbi:hypothetical protein JTB14_037880 [Gonioctena quinquepunctata]|nr:hypothetical protein JTB14_037880 [Gonioctena quinquepunctata]